MKEVLMSIKPQWAAMIYDKRKEVELRKTAPKLPFKVYFLESGTKTITGEAIVREALIYTTAPSQGIDQRLLTAARVTAEQFHDYAKREPVYAFFLTSVVKYDTPRPYQGHVPQSWQYI